MRFLPQRITWISPYSLPNTWAQILIAARGDSVQQYSIYMGWVHPIKNYTQTIIYAKPCGLRKDCPDVLIKKEDIFAVAIIPHTGEVL